MPYYGLTEAQVIELIQRHTAQTGRVKSTEYALPSEILEGLEDSSSKELRTNTQKFTKKPCNTTEASGPSQAQSIRCLSKSLRMQKWMHISRSNRGSKMEIDLELQQGE